MIRCENIVSILNNLHNDKELISEHCLSGNHKYKADKIKLKLAERKIITLELEETDNIYNPLSFVLSHINNKKFTSKKENKYAFNALLLILAIIEDYKIIELRKSNSIVSDKKIINKILPLLQIDQKYIFTIPNKIQYSFKVFGYELAKMTTRKLK